MRCAVRNPGKTEKRILPDCAVRRPDSFETTDELAVSAYTKRIGTPFTVSAKFSARRSCEVALRSSEAILNAPGAQLEQDKTYVRTALDSWRSGNRAVFFGRTFVSRIAVDNKIKRDSSFRICPIFVMRHIRHAILEMNQLRKSASDSSTYNATPQIDLD